MQITVNTRSKYQIFCPVKQTEHEISASALNKALQYT